MNGSFEDNTHRGETSRLVAFVAGFFAIVAGVATLRAFKTWRDRPSNDVEGDQVSLENASDHSAEDYNRQGVLSIQREAVIDPSTLPPLSNNNPSLPTWPDNYQVSISQLRRDLLLDLFVGVVMAIAYHEMIHCVSDSFNQHGIDTGTIMLVVIFLVTSIRYFLGNRLFLTHPDYAASEKSLRWYLDYTVILVQTIIIAFLGTVCSSYVETRIGLLHYLTALYVINVLWIGMSLMVADKRKKVPKVWFAIDLCNIAAFLWLGIFMNGLSAQVPMESNRFAYTGNFIYASLSVDNPRFLLFVTAINVVAAVADFLFQSDVYRGQSDKNPI